MIITPQRLVEIKEREEKATKGPWVNQRPNIQEAHMSVVMGPERKTAGGFGVRDIVASCKPEHVSVNLDRRQCSLNSEFIAHARQDIPDLLTALEEMEGENKELSLRLKMEMDCHETSVEEVNSLRSRLEEVERESEQTRKLMLAQTKYYLKAESNYDHEIARIKAERDEALECAGKALVIEPASKTIKDLRSQLEKAKKVMRLLPLEYFNKDESQIDAADFVDCSSEFVAAMNAARAYLSANPTQGKEAGNEND